MSLNTNAKKKRSCNFSREEELRLLEQIRRYKNIIECKTTNKISHNEKETAWNKILIHFNCANVLNRSLDQIKAKYDNLKTKARKEVAQTKSHIRGTGGGEAIKYEVDPVSQAVLEIINHKTVVGLENPYDADNTNPVDVLEVISSEGPTCSAQSGIDHDIIIEDYTGDLAVPSTSQTTGDLAVPLTSQTEVCQVSEVPHKALSDLQNRFNLSEDEEGPSDVTPMKMKQWSSYVPRDLKKPPNKKLKQSTNKLRSQVLSPLGETKTSYYKRKMELLEASENQDREIKKRRQEREEEEH